MASDVETQLRRVEIGGLVLVVWSIFVTSIEYAIVLADLSLAEKIRRGVGFSACALATILIGGSAALAAWSALRRSPTVYTITKSVMVIAIVYGLAAYAAALFYLYQTTPLANAIAFGGVDAVVTLAWIIIWVRARRVFLQWVSELGS